MTANLFPENWKQVGSPLGLLLSQLPALKAKTGSPKRGKKLGRVSRGPLGVQDQPPPYSCLCGLSLEEGRRGVPGVQGGGRPTHGALRATDLFRPSVGLRHKGRRARGALPPGFLWDDSNRAAETRPPGGAEEGSLRVMSLQPRPALPFPECGCVDRVGESAPRGGALLGLTW